MLHNLYWGFSQLSISLRNSNRKRLYYHSNFGVKFLEIKTFIQAGYFKLIKSDIKNIYDATKDLYFK